MIKVVESTRRGNPVWFIVNNGVRVAEVYSELWANSIVDACNEVIALGMADMERGRGETT